MKKILVLFLLSITAILWACTHNQTSQQKADEAFEHNHWNEMQQAQDLANSQTGGQSTYDLVFANSWFAFSGMDVNYGSGNWYIAVPQWTESKGWIILIHERWGLNDNIKKMADTLAKQGYTALAVDLYNGKVAATQQEAGTLSSSVNNAEALKNMQAALAYLKDNYDVDKLATLGWCFGWAQSLNVAMNAGNDIDAAIIYYGRLQTSPEALSGVKAPVLWFFGGKDTSIPTDSVNAFKDSLNELDVENQIEIYPNVGHAFANPTWSNYAQSETIDAWNKTLAFLEKNL